MKPESGRGQLYNSLKALRERWRDTTEVWNDSARSEFEADVWEPLGALSQRTLEAMDELAQLLAKVRQECQGNPDTYF